MARNDGYRRYFEAAAVLGEITRARAEELVRELMSSGDMQRAQAQQWVDELVSRSRKAAEDLLDLVRTEVSSQMQALGLDPDELARQAAEILRRSAGAGRRIVQDVAPGGRASKKAAEKAARGKAAAKKAAGAKKAAAKKGAPKKSAPKKAAPKKGAPKKGAPKASGSKKSAPEKSAPDKSAAKKRAAKKSATGARTPVPAATH
jgi:polyhydroxyalkanoate synthesis regulator phasin